jgi:hypothetical protein
MLGGTRSRTETSLVRSAPLLIRAIMKTHENLSAMLTRLAHRLSRRTRGDILLHVRAARQYLQIVDPVVGLILVDVVDSKPALQLHLVVSLVHVLRPRDSRAVRRRDQNGHKPTFSLVPNLVRSVALVWKRGHHAFGSIHYVTPKYRALTERQPYQRTEKLVEAALA